MTFSRPLINQSACVICLSHIIKTRIAYTVCNPEKVTVIIFIHPALCYKILSGGRVGASKVLVIVTDDKSSGEEPVKEAVKPLQDKGVRIYIVNIGPRPEEQETKDIVSDEKNILTPKTTDELPNIAPELAKKMTDDTNDSKFFAKRASNKY